MIQYGQVVTNKPVEEVIACVIDYGTFTALAEKLAETMKVVYYYTPNDKEYKDVQDASLGSGLPKVKKLSDLFDTEVFKSIDLFIFPDIGFGGLQKHLRDIGKAVWGSMGADELELFRDFFIETIEKVGLPYVKSETVYGLTALAKKLKRVNHKWIKINSYRANMETWYHLNYEHSIRMLDSLAVTFGGAKEQVTFVVQDEIESDVECGYDGWCIDGLFPSCSYQGYEKKNELYLGTVLENDDIPEEIVYVNEKMAPILAAYGYRNWWATEIRVKDGVPFFIDPTARHPGQTGEHQWETCANLADVIWQGANGDIIVPEFEWKFAAEATLHYTASSNSSADEWKTLQVPDKARRWFKPYHYCMVGDTYHFTPSSKDEVGVILGVGNSIKEAIDHIKKNLKIMDDLPIHANMGGFVSLIESIQEAEKAGIKFADDIPDPKTII